MSAKAALGVVVWGALAITAGLGAASGCSSSGSNTDCNRTGTCASSSVVSSVSTTSGSTSASGTGSTGITDANSSSTGGSCSLPNPLPSGGLLYSGGIPAPNCPTTVAYPNNYWFSYWDSTTAGTMDASAFNFIHTADFGGCDGTNDCAFHTSGMNIPGYGAGVGFTLNNNAIDPDAAGYTGLQLWLKGTTTGTRGPRYSQGDNMVHVKFVTALSDGGDPRLGDNYGAYCPTVSDAGAGAWVPCRLPFGGLTRDGFKGLDAGAPDPSSDTFDPQNLVKIQFEFSSYTPPADSGATQQVSFDVWIDDVAFY